MIILLGETLLGEIFVRANFRHFPKNLSLSPNKVSPDKVEFFYEKDTYVLLGHMKVPVLVRCLYYGMHVLRGLTVFLNLKTDSMRECKNKGNNTKR